MWKPCRSATIFCFSIPWKLWWKKKEQLYDKEQKTPRPLCRGYWTEHAHCLIWQQPSGATACTIRQSMHASYHLELNGGEFKDSATLSAFLDLHGSVSIYLGADGKVDHNDISSLSRVCPTADHVSSDKEWFHICMLSKSLQRTLWQPLHFCTPSYACLRQANISSQEEIYWPGIYPILCKNRQFLLFLNMTDREGLTPHTPWLRRWTVITHLGPLLWEQTHCLQTVLHADHQEAFGTIDWFTPKS